MSVKFGMMGLVCTMVLAAGAAASAPVIKDFSSTGGKTQNKTSPRDRMYLVQGGEKITFTVKTSGAEKYLWQVNKKVRAKGVGDSFVWTVPNEKGIWEIHLEATGGKANAHQEWVVSTLSKAEAPDFFDYFTDGKWKNRTDTDPWGRKLPEWKKNDERPGQVTVDTSCCSLKMNGDLFNGAKIYAPQPATHGTWRCKFRVTPPLGTMQGMSSKDGRVTIAFSPLTGGRPPASAYITMAAESEGHNWAGTNIGPKQSVAVCTTPLVGDWGMSDSVSIHRKWYGGKWKDLKIIRTKDNFLYFWKDTGLHGHNGYFVDCLIDSNPFLPGAPDPLRKSLNIGCMAKTDGGAKLSRGEIDCIEIYKDKFVSPKKIFYGKYVNSYKQYGDGKPYTPLYRKGILADGFGLRLADIAKAINDKTLFRYVSGTRTADCYTDLCIRAGAELILAKGETLRMHCRSDGEHQIRVNNGATIRLDGAAITGPEHYYKWILPSEFTPCPEYGHPYAPVFTGRFIARNSTINNCGGLYFAGPTEVVLDNVKLTNLVEIAYPSPPHTGVVFRSWCGDSGPNHALSFRGHQVCSRLLIKGCRVSARQDKKMTVKFISMDAVVGNATIYDSVLKNASVQAKDGYFYYWGYKYPTTLNLVNTRFGKIIAPTDKSTVVPRYYLDVKVFDKAGRPVRGAKVRVVNEVDRKFISLGKIQEKAKNWYSLVIDTKSDPLDTSETFIWAPAIGYARQRKILKDTGKKSVEGQCLIGRKMPWYGKPLSKTTTGADGHTPLPKDAGHTMVLADYALDKSGKKEFKYTITVEASGQKKVITGVNPGPSWYRPDPNKPTYTITAVLDGKTITETGLKKKGLAGLPEK